MYSSSLFYCGHSIIALRTSGFTSVYELEKTFYSRLCYSGLAYIL